MLCKESKEYLTKIADILAQLLQADDSTELQIAQNSLLSLFKIDAKGDNCFEVLLSIIIHTTLDIFTL